MKFPVVIIFAVWVFSACQSSPEQPTPIKTEEGKPDTVRFFAVTSYIKGQLIDIKQNGLTPLKYIIQGNKTDSAFLHLDSLPGAVAAFLTPRIDSVNLKPWFAQSIYRDQSLENITFTYAPKAAVPADIPLRRWDVYINEETQKVKRVFIIKQLNPETIQQLTWKPAEGCRILTLQEKDGNSRIIKEEKISWSY